MIFQVDLEWIHSACYTIARLSLISNDIHLQINKERTSKHRERAVHAFVLYLSLPISCVLISTWHKTTNKFKLKYQSYRLGRLCRAIRFFFFYYSTAKAGGWAAFSNTTKPIPVFFQCVSVANMWKCKYLQNVKSIEQNDSLWRRRMENMINPMRDREKLYIVEKKEHIE